jgi:hypothetical protein
MDGYRYWVERHKLLVELERAKAELGGLGERERGERTVELERAFRGKLDLLYSQARTEFEPSR